MRVSGKCSIDLFPVEGRIRRLRRLCLYLSPQRLMSSLSENVRKVVMLSSLGVDRRDDLMMKLKSFSLKNFMNDLDVKVRSVRPRSGKDNEAFNLMAGTYQQEVRQEVLYMDPSTDDGDRSASAWQHAAEDVLKGSAEEYGFDYTLIRTGKLKGGGGENGLGDEMYFENPNVMQVRRTGSV